MLRVRVRARARVRVRARARVRVRARAMVRVRVRVRARARARVRVRLRPCASSRAALASDAAWLAGGEHVVNGGEMGGFGGGWLEHQRRWP